MCVARGTECEGRAAEAVCYAVGTQCSDLDPNGDRGNPAGTAMVVVVRERDIESERTDRTRVCVDCFMSELLMVVLLCPDLSDRLAMSWPNASPFSPHSW